MCVCVCVCVSVCVCACARVCVCAVQTGFLIDHEIFFRMNFMFRLSNFLVSFRMSESKWWRKHFQLVFFRVTVGLDLFFGCFFVSFIYLESLLLLLLLLLHMVGPFCEECCYHIGTCVKRYFIYVILFIFNVYCLKGL